MAREFTMPKLGLTMTDGTIRAWLVADGAMVKAGDPVLVIETDKVETEVEARDDGILTRTGVIGETYECGAVIGYLRHAGETLVPAAPSSALSSALRPPSFAPVPSAEPARAEMPVQPAVRVGTDLAVRGDRDRILASPRARARARELGVELAHVAGTGPLGRIVADDVTAAAAQARAAVRAAPPHVAPAATVAPEPAAPAGLTSGERAAGASLGVMATAGARMLAELLGVDMNRIPVAAGSRMTREDVAAWVRGQLVTTDASPLAEPSKSGGAVPAAIADSPLLQQPSEVVPLRGVRALIATRMHRSLTEMAQLTLSIDVDMTAVNSERDRCKSKDLTVPGYTAWVAAAASRALVDHPYVNSQVTSEGVALLPDIHLGVAVALDAGLIVPVVTHADRLTVEELHGEVAELAARAREAKLAFSEIEGATFSLTALGMYGVDMFTPVINPPNTAILGVGRLRTDTRWLDGVASPRTVMTLSLTWDHRAFDGAPAARFAQSIVGYLENPSLLLG